MNRQKYLFGRGVTTDDEDHVRDRRIEHRNTNREAVELSLELGEDFGDSGGRAGGGGGQVQHARACTTKVLETGVVYIDENEFFLGGGRRRSQSQ